MLDDFFANRIQPLIGDFQYRQIKPPRLKLLINPFDDLDNNGFVASTQRRKMISRHIRRDLASTFFEPSKYQGVSSSCNHYSKDDDSMNENPRGYNQNNLPARMGQPAPNINQETILSFV